MTLTTSQRRYLQTIYELGYSPPPTIREITMRLGFRSSHSVTDMVRRLKKRGLVEQGSRGLSRTLRVTHAGLEALGLRQSSGVNLGRRCACGAMYFGLQCPFVHRGRKDEPPRLRSSV